MRTYDWGTKYRLEQNDAGYPTGEAIRLVDGLVKQFKSADKDNMEFSVTATCYQKEALEAVLAFVCHIY